MCVIFNKSKRGVLHRDKVQAIDKETNNEKIMNYFSFMFEKEIDETLKLHPTIKKGIRNKLLIKYNKLFNDKLLSGEKVDDAYTDCVIPYFLS